MVLGSSPRRPTSKFQRCVSPKRNRGIAQQVEQRSPKPRAEGSIPSAPAKSLGRFRSDREKTRKAEISRDFSAFFAPNFFRISIDPFSIFLRVEGFELPKTHFFMNRIRNTSDRKDLNPRQGFKFFRFFALDTNCLQIVPSKTDPSLLRKDSNPGPTGYEPVALTN